MRRAPCLLVPWLAMACASASGPAPGPATTARAAVPAAPVLRPLEIRPWIGELLGAILPVPEEARVTLEADEEEYFVGEAVTLRFVVANTGSRPFGFSRGFGESNDRPSPSIQARATHEDGTEAEDARTPEDFPSNFILPPIVDLAPGATASVPFDLRLHRWVDRPGTWFVQAGHDFGWTSEPGRPIPVATLAVRIRECPDPEALQWVEAVLSDRGSDPAILAEARYLPYLERQARRGRGLFADLESKPKRAISAIRDLAMKDPGLALPVMERLARAGGVGVARALGSIPTPGASRILVDMLQAMPPEVLEWDPDHVGWLLLLRLPPPRRKTDWALPEPASSDEQVAAFRASWDPGLAPRVRAWAVRRLEDRGERGPGETPFQVLECIGEAGDAPAYREALRRRVEKIPGTAVSRLQEGELQTAEDLLEGYLAIASPPPSIPVPPRDLLEVLEFLHSIRRRWDAERDRAVPRTLPPGGEAVLLDLLRHPLPCVRNWAVDRCPDPVPASVLERIAGLLEDPDPDVRCEACDLAGRSGDASLVGLLVRRIREDALSWVAERAYFAGVRIGQRDAVSRAMVGHLRADDPQRFEALTHLACAHFEEVWKVGTGTELPAPDDAWNPLEERWTEFLDAMKGRLGPAERLPLDDPATRADLLRGFLLFRFKDGRTFPPEDPLPR